MDSKPVDSKQQPLREVRQGNLPSATKLPLPQSKIKPPTPSASFKRPALAVFADDPGSKRLRLDISSALVDTQKAEKASKLGLMSRSKSMASVRLKPKVARTAVPVQHGTSVISALPGSTLSKAPSLNCFASLKPSASVISAPTTKTGKRPVWDLKGRMQDTEDALNSIKIQNYDLIKTTEVYNQRLAALESTNHKLSEEVKSKETLSTEKSNKVEKLEGQLDKKTKECNQLAEQISALQSELKMLKSDLTSAQQTNSSLENTIATLSSTQTALKAQLTATQLEFDNCITNNKQLNENIDSLKSDMCGLENRLLDSEKKIREDEAVRRRLHNTIQELKGNIRVFCRVRPLLSSDNTKMTMISYPDMHNRSMEITKVSSSDEGSKNRGIMKYTFNFDRVFDGDADQEMVFNEVSQLVQSSLDGYNVCVFAYGQTGSGKTFTMTGSVDIDSHECGLIPRTVQQIFDSVKSLEAKGWQYCMEATFIEIYNEAIRDLLGNSLDTKVKHEIKMCDTKGSDIYVSNLTTVAIVSQEQVYELLSRANKNRAVGSTFCNERSSRSHSIFRLQLSGKNDKTSETCQGMLNLVDLAGSERLKESQSEGDRLKETKSINKSLSNLANVITSLANKNEHIPYRNSKLTHILMSSLGGNSKTLMVVNVSPCEDAINETLNSLRFAATVNQCEIGTAHKKLRLK